MKTCLAALAIGCCAMMSTAAADEAYEEGFVQSGDVKIHYVTQGEGPLIVMIHGFPDFWYTWRRQIPVLAEHFQVVAIDQRGYNKSDAPKGVEHYTVSKLVGDVVAVVDHFGARRATIVGHDWGGLVAWNFAMQHPDRTERLVVLNLPHPKGLMRELAGNPQQQQNSQYARDFQQADAASKLTPERLASWVRDPDAKQKYIEAFRRSSIEAMLNYYKASYPPQPYTESTTEYPRIKCPVLMFHGLQDQALLPAALNDTWLWLDRDLTLITIPNAGHFVQRDAADLVTDRMARWLIP